MAQCVRILPTTEPVAVANGAYVSALYPLLVVEPSCAAGLKVLTMAEIAELKQTLKVDSSSDPARVQDMTDLFYVFLLVLVVVWGIKQLLNLFTGDTSKD